MRLFFLLLTFCLSACGPNNKSQPFVPTTPTANPITPIINPLVNYYSLIFVGTSSSVQSSGILITGNQRVYLPGQIQGDGTGYPQSLHLFSSSFSCEYVLIGTAYSKSSSCQTHYQLVNQVIYINGLSLGQTLNLFLGI